MELWKKFYFFLHLVILLMSSMSVVIASFSLPDIGNLYLLSFFFSVLLKICQFY